MIINKIYNLSQFLIYILLPILLNIFVDVQSFAQSSVDDVRAVNVKWALKNEVIVLNYELPGSPDKKYDVKVIMKRESDPIFYAVPATVEGDIGEGYFSGLKKEIRWYYRRDYPQGLQGEDYFFEIQVKEVAKPNTLLYYIAGGVAVTAGVVALLMSKNPSSPPPRELPFPPVRPLD